MTAILHMADDFIQRINHTEPGSVKEFYKKFQTDFDAEVQKIVDGIAELK